MVMPMLMLYAIGPKDHYDKVSLVITQVLYMLLNLPQNTMPWNRVCNSWYHWWYLVHALSHPRIPAHRKGCYLLLIFTLLHHFLINIVHPYLYSLYFTYTSLYFTYHTFHTLSGCLPYSYSESKKRPNDVPMLKDWSISQELLIGIRCSMYRWKGLHYSFPTKVI